MRRTEAHLGWLQPERRPDKVHRRLLLPGGGYRAGRPGRPHYRPRLAAAAATAVVPLLPVFVLTDDGGRRGDGGGGGGSIRGRKEGETACEPRYIETTQVPPWL